MYVPLCQTIGLVGALFFAGSGHARPQWARIVSPMPYQPRLLMLPPSRLQVPLRPPLPIPRPVLPPVRAPVPPQTRVQSPPPVPKTASPAARQPVFPKPGQALLTRFISGLRWNKRSIVRALKKFSDAREFFEALHPENGPTDGLEALNRENGTIFVPVNAVLRRAPNWFCASESSCWYRASRILVHFMPDNFTTILPEEGVFVTDAIRRPVNPSDKTSLLDSSSSDSALGSQSGASRQKLKLRKVDDKYFIDCARILNPAKPDIYGSVAVYYIDRPLLSMYERAYTEDGIKENKCLSLSEWLGTFGE